MVSAAALAAGLLWCVAVASGVVHFGCVWKTCTGVPCAGCGGTRAVLLLASGQAMEALRMNPGVVLALAVIGMLNAHAAVVLLFKRNPWRPGPAAGARLRWGTVVAVAANWIYLVAAARV